MAANIFQSFTDIPVKETISGFYSQFIHTETNTINFIEHIGQLPVRENYKNF